MLRIALGVFFATILLIAGFAFFIPHANEGEKELALPVVVIPTVSEIILTDSYKKGLHTLTGSVEAPTPCTSLEVHGEVASSTPPLITISIAMPPDTGICLQQITELPFKVTVPATIDATIEVWVNGTEASTTIKKT